MQNYKLIHFDMTSAFNRITVSLILITTFFKLHAQEQLGRVPSFDKIIVHDSFVAEGVTVADINNDGQIDIIAGAFWFEAPNWKKHEITVPVSFVYNKGYSDAFVHFAMDVDQDGWVDIIRIDQPGHEVVWYKNPKNELGHWQEYLIYEHFGNETPMLVDIDGDGRPDLVGNDPVKEEVVWLKSPGVKGETTWQKNTISTQKGLGTHMYTHGLGVVDFDKDGRPDILISGGWWKNPNNPESETEWQFYKEKMSEESAQMYLLDVDSDGLVDVLSSSPHNYGIWWYKQSVNSNGERDWQQKLIDDSFSQSHALALVDINNDGQPDLITGKRYYAHNGGDPGANEPAVLYWFEHTADVPPFWKKHLIDDDSGAGMHIVVEDMNADGLKDIVVSNKKGVFYFRQK